MQNVTSQETRSLDEILPGFPKLEGICFLTPPQTELFWAQQESIFWHAKHESLRRVFIAIGGIQLLTILVMGTYIAFGQR